jgi:hypothetical protein
MQRELSQLANQQPFGWNFLVVTQSTTRCGHPAYLLALSIARTFRSSTMQITILSIKDGTTFFAHQSATPAQIRRLVAQRYGYQSIGVPHSWVATANESQEYL